MSANSQRSVGAVLTIAGSDSGGGAGIQADLKTIAAHGLLGCTAITAITAQNTAGIDASEAVAPQLVEAQIEAVLRDLPVRAVKTGMLATSANVAVVARVLARHPDLPLVVDPIVTATSGRRLLSDRGVQTLRDQLLPLADVVTPNLPEAAVLLGVPEIVEVTLAAREIAELAGTQTTVVIKGGHRTDSPRSADLARLPDGRELWLEAERVRPGRDHGTGCVFSAAIAAGLALGEELVVALERAKEFVTGALVHAPALGGAGPSPVDPLWRLLPR